MDPGRSTDVVAILKQITPNSSNHLKEVTPDVTDAECQGRPGAP